MSRHTPRYTPSSTMHRPTKRDPQKILVWIVVLVGGLIFTGASSLICCGVLVSQQEEKKNSGREADVSAEQHDETKTQSEQWHERLVEHLREGRREQASRMFPEEFQAPESNAERLGLMLDVLNVATTQEHGLVKFDVETEVIDGEVVETRSSYVHVASRKAHNYDVGVVIELARDASGALEVKEYTMTILSVGKNKKVVTHWGESFSSIEAMGGFKEAEDALAKRVRPMKRKSACVEYFTPYGETFRAHPKPLEVDKKNIDPVIGQMCEIISQELRRKGVEQVGLSVTIGSTKGMEGLIRDWVSGHIVGLPASIKYEYARGGQTRTLEIHASSTVDLRHPDRQRSWTIDGYRLEVKEENGSETVSFHMRDVFRGYSVPYVPAR